MNQMKFSISGSQGTGKTTLLEALTTQPATQDFFQYNSPSRQAFKLGFGINTNCNNISQLYIYNKHLENIVLAKQEQCIFDRCILDAVAYSLVSLEDRIISEYVVEYGTNLLLEILPLYNKIFYIKPEFNIVPDGVRNTDEKYRKRVSKKYEDLIHIIKARKNMPEIIYLSGSVEQRVETIKKHINV